MVSLKIGAFGKVLLRYASSQVLSNALRVLSGFLVVRLLPPSEYGIFTGVSVYLGYVLLGHLGIVNGIGRELPFELGKGNREYANKLANAAFSVSILVGIVAFLIFIGISVFYFLHNDFIFGITFLANAFLAGFHVVSKYFLPVLYRTNSDFDKLSHQNISVGVANLASVALVWYFGFYGLLMRAVLLVLIEFFLLYFNKPMPLAISVNPKNLKTLFRTGLPIYAVGQIGPLWTTIVNNVMFVTGGPAAFGLYALSSIVQSTVAMVPASFSQVIYPRMSAMYGQGMQPSQIVKSNYRALAFQFAVMTGIALVGIVLLPYVIPYILPNYTGGIRAAQWILFVPVVNSLAIINTIFNVIKNQRPYILALLSGAVVGTLYIYLRISVVGFQLEIFPQGLLVGAVFQQMLCLYFISRLVRNNG